MFIVKRVFQIDILELLHSDDNFFWLAPQKAINNDRIKVSITIRVAFMVIFFKRYLGI